MKQITKKSLSTILGFTILFTMMPSLTFLGIKTPSNVTESMAGSVQIYFTNSTYTTSVDYGRNFTPEAHYHKFFLNYYNGRKWIRKPLSAGMKGLHGHWQGKGYFDSHSSGWQTYYFAIVRKGEKAVGDMMVYVRPKPEPTWEWGKPKWKDRYINISTPTSPSPFSYGSHGGRWRVSASAFGNVHANFHAKK